MQAGSEQHAVAAAAETTKTRIERAAVALFAARGVDAVTIREIAAESGLSEGALYRHYPGKAALAEALFFGLQKSLAQTIRETAARPGAIDDRASAIVDAYCQAADDDWPLFSYHLLNAHRFLPGAAGRAQKAVDNPVVETETLVQQAMDAGALPKGDARLKAAMALGVVLQTALHKYYGRISGDLSKCAPAMKKSVLAVLHCQS